MTCKEPSFDWGGDLIKWRIDYVKNWIKENHPALVCDYRKTKVGGYDLWIYLNSNFSEDEILAHIQLPEKMEDSKDVIGKATIMRGLHAFSAPIMCQRIEKKIRMTGNVEKLNFLDAIAKKIKFDII